MLRMVNFVGFFLSKMSDNEIIEHQGIIVGINKKVVSVQITNQSACASCHAKGACSSSDLMDKIIEINTPVANLFNEGQIVSIGEKSSQGFIAVFWAYILPTILILSYLIISSQYISNEIIVGLSTLGLVTLYFIVLYLFRSKLKNSFTFTIKNLY